MSGDIASVIETRIKLTMVDNISETLKKSTKNLDDFNKKTEESGETIRKINQRADESGERSRRLLSRAGALTMGLGGLLKMVTQNDKELKRYTDTFTDGVTAVGGFMWAVSELRGELKDLIPDLKAAGKEIKTFFKTRSKTDLGLIGLAAGSVAAVAYAVYTGAKEKYDAYENGQPLEILDEYGNTITYTHDLTKTRRVSGDDADHWEILQKDANGKAYDYRTVADKLAEAVKKIKTPKINVPKISIPKTYDITVPIGELVRDTAAQHPEGEKWMGTVTADATKQCDSYLAMLYESVGAGFQRAIVNDADFKEKGAYHIAGQGYKPEVGDMVDFLQHVGVYMGNGMIQSRQSRGGVRTVTMAEAEKMFGSIQGYGSIREATGGKMATITLDENGKKLRDLAEETADSYTKIQRIFAELNSDIADLTGGAGEFDRFIAAAAGKLAGYQEDIAAAQNRGLDVSALKSKIQEFWEACNIKAKEIKQDEILSRLGMEEKSITQMADLGSVSLDRQRKLLNEKLEAHKQFLETILQEEDMSAKRRFDIETQLTDTVKRLHEAAAYDVKQGWMLGLQEVANQQTNFKDTTTGLFDSLETGMADLIVSGGNVKNFFADFFKMILRSLTQILIKQLISSALMKALGGGGGSISVGDISNSFASSFTGGSLFEAGGIGVSGFASGGSVQDGPPISHKNHSIKGAISGGYITGPGSETSDSIPAFLSKGEYVVKADAVKRIGVDVLDAINRGSIAHYASGGSVQTGQTVTNNSLQTIKEIIKGGFVKGPGTETSDSVPALLSRGEYVIKAEAVKKIGLPVLDALNHGEVAHYAGGGSVQTGRLMGESGPELLRLAEKNNTPHIGREKETADNRPIVNIEIINNTGTPMKAREESTFDGMRQLRKIIIDTASTAAYTNEGGFRDAIQGAAAARG